MSDPFLSYYPDVAQELAAKEQWLQRLAEHWDEITTAGEETTDEEGNVVYVIRAALAADGDQTKEGDHG